MKDDHAIRFFDEQFARQRLGPEVELNPFERLALPHLHGRVLDYGCGMGQLALAAARAGCSVLALDASAIAIEHLQRKARAGKLALSAQVADLREHRLDEDFDSIVSIGLLMFFDCAAALRALDHLEAHLRPGGSLVLNVLIEGTTYMAMFDPGSRCLFARDALVRRYAGWDELELSYSEYPAPGGLMKAFATMIARKPARA
ncbi:MAG: class I SAM-dependent methyltransferase [Burkholderiales bacterium]|nr:class I SAM-dependent methyltransferase [Burkholderiales bacterium]MDE2398196.1 class I SAM-dependent methyltransferase [Burkholderiales bacterium]MDE2453598.1 class I SAM-dependent methyltransferase [Burkholderiales bacterium]